MQSIYDVSFMIVWRNKWDKTKTNTKCVNVNQYIIVRLKCQYTDRLIAVLKQVELERGEFSTKKIYGYTRTYQDLISMIQCMCKGHLFL